MTDPDIPHSLAGFLWEEGKRYDGMKARRKGRKRSETKFGLRIEIDALDVDTIAAHSGGLQ